MAKGRSRRNLIVQGRPGEGLVSTPSRSPQGAGRGGLSGEDIDAAEAMLASLEIGVTQIAHCFAGDALSTHPRRTNRVSVR